MDQILNESFLIDQKRSQSFDSSAAERGASFTKINSLLQEVSTTFLKLKTNSLISEQKIASLQ